MNLMDHAAAHERIEDLLLEPVRLAALDASSEPGDVALREHVAGCPACRADLEGWQRLQGAVSTSLSGMAPADATTAVEPIDLPPSLRASVITEARAAGRPMPDRSGAGPAGPVSVGAGRAPRALRVPLLAAAAALIVLVGAVGLSLDQAARRESAEAEARALAAALTSIDRVLAAPHKVVELRTPSGQAAGTISWSRHDWVVITTALARPTDGRQYQCWLAQEGRNVPVGLMEFAGETAYWVASLDEWQTWEIGPTTRFVVTLEPPGAQQPTGATVLEALLAG